MGHEMERGDVFLDAAGSHKDACMWLRDSRYGEMTNMIEKMP